VAWIESVSPSFRARHDSSQTDAAERLLDSLELARERLADRFPRTVGDIAVVLHGGMLSLSMAMPALPLAWILTSPAARRYVAGWCSGDELHVLAPAALDLRASNVQGSRQMLALTADALYARLVVDENNPDLPRRLTPARLAAELRWAWLLEGAARWFSGQTALARPAIARRLREGSNPSFPPGVRDAVLLGGTVIDLLVSERGESAAAQFACRLDPQGPRSAMHKAFRGRPLTETEGVWRSHLARMAEAAR
jgi:hypothetical protein